MKFYDIVYEIARNDGLSIERLSLKLGRGPNYVGGAKNRGSLPKVDNAAMIVDACGYALCVVPKDEVPDGAYIVDWKKDGE